MNPVKKNNYPALTGLRAIAAYLVFFHHNPIVFSSFHPWAVLVAEQGYVGVSIFYVLSGFLIHRAYGSKQEPPSRAVHNFFINRFARIYPLYFVICIITLSFTSTPFGWIWLINLTLLKGFSDIWKFSGVAQAWSLTVEVCFYLVAPLLFSLRTRVKSLIPILIGIYAIACIFLYIGQRIQWEGVFSNTRFVLLYSFPGRAFEFFVGIYCSEKLLIKENRTPVYTKTVWFTSLGGLGLLFAIAALAWIAQNTQVAYGVFSWPGLMFHNYLTPIPIAFLLYGLADERSTLSRILSSPSFIFLGKISYAFYLLHVGPIAAMIGKSTSNVWITFVALNVAAGTAFLIIEEPLNKRIRKLSTG